MYYCYRVVITAATALHTAAAALCAVVSPFLAHPSFIIRHACMSHHQRCHCGSASAKSTSHNLRRCHESVSASVPEGGQNANPKSRCRHEHTKALPPEGKRKHGVISQGNPNKGNREPSLPSRASSCEDVLSTWEGPGPWDPGGRHVSELKRPAEAMDTAASIVACNKKHLDVQKSSQCQHVIADSAFLGNAPTSC